MTVATRVIDPLPTTAERLPAPVYAQTHWLTQRLPQTSAPWLPVELDRHLWLVHGGAQHVHARIVAYGQSKPFVLPSRPLFFLCDIHADADAFLGSLVASGGVCQYGPGDRDFALTDLGRTGHFVIGGDCFDKGPSTLRLLRTLQHLVELDADLTILAGNHDIRTLLGLLHIGAQSPEAAHLFVRMGKKTVPLLREVHDAYACDADDLDLSEAEMEALLFPGQSWFDNFDAVARPYMPAARITKEKRRIAEKVIEFRRACTEQGLTFRAAYQAAQRARQLFCDEQGEFAWLFRRMQLAARWGSCLLVHAGVDDRTAGWLREHGVDSLNDEFRRLLSYDPFALYHGPLGNMFRTKYRALEPVLTERGVADLHEAGVYAIVHGHQNLLAGQRITLREGMLNFECDCSVDAGTRRIEGLPGLGAAATVLRPDGLVMGISVDHERAKVFDLAKVFLSVTTASHRSANLAGCDGGVTTRGPARKDCMSDEHATATPVTTRPEPTTDKLRFKTTLASDEAASYLEAIVSGLRAGLISFHRENDTVVLEPKGQLQLEVKAHSKAEKGKLEFELSWKTSTDTPPGLEIGSASDAATSRSEPVTADG